MPTIWAHSCSVSRVSSQPDSVSSGHTGRPSLINPSSSDRPPPTTRSTEPDQKKWKRESGQTIMTTLPTIDEPLTGPHMRLSHDRVRLSPITK